MTLFDGVAVLATQVKPTEMVHWAQNSTWLVMGDNPSEPLFLEELLKKAYKIVLQFGHLILMTVYFPAERCSLMLWKGVHEPLYLTSEAIWDETDVGEFVAETTHDFVVGFSMMATLRKHY